MAIAHKTPDQWVDARDVRRLFGAGAEARVLQRRIEANGKEFLLLSSVAYALRVPLAHARLVVMKDELNRLR